MTETRRSDVVKLEESLRRSLRQVVVGQFRLLPRGVHTDTSVRLEALWDRLVTEGPGVEMIRQLVEAYEGFTAAAMRRESLYARLVPIIDGADDLRLSSLSQLVAMFEALPIPLAVDDDIVEAEIVDDAPRKRTDCVGCGAEIRFDAPTLNTDEPEPGRGWVHVSDDRVECDTGEGIARLSDDEPF